MRTITLIAAIFVLGVTLPANADGRKGSHRVGGDGSHGRGSHYVGGYRPGLVHRMLRKM